MSLEVTLASQICEQMLISDAHTEASVYYTSACAYVSTMYIEFTFTDKSSFLWQNDRQCTGVHEITSCGSEGCWLLTVLDFGVLKTEPPFWADFVIFAEPEGVASTSCSSCRWFWLESARICDNSGSSVERSIDGTGPAALVWTCGPTKLLLSTTMLLNNYLSSKLIEIVTR